METAIVKSGRGGVRIGAGRHPTDPIVAAARARDRAAIERARRPSIALLIRVLRDEKQDIDRRIKVALELLDRGGMSKMFSIAGDTEGLTPDMLAAAMHAAADSIASDPTRGRVEAEYEEVVGGQLVNGDGQAH